MRGHFLSRLHEPRVRSWVQAGLAIAAPLLMYALLWLAAILDRPMQGLGPVLLLMVAAIAAAGLSMMALFSGVAGLLELEAPRPLWRYLEPLLLGLPFQAFATMFVTMTVASVAYS